MPADAQLMGLLRRSGLGKAIVCSAVRCFAFHDVCNFLLIRCFLILYPNYREFFGGASCCSLQEPEPLPHDAFMPRTLSLARFAILLLLPMSDVVAINLPAKLPWVWRSKRILSIDESISLESRSYFPRANMALNVGSHGPHRNLADISSNRSLAFSHPSMRGEEWQSGMLI